MLQRIQKLRVAIVHHWLVSRGGGERVVEELAAMFPEADIFTLVLDRSTLSPALRSRRITSSFLQKIPGAVRHHTKFLPLFPLALEQFRLDDYDLVISSESGPAKGVLTSQHTCHICYCHSPMRYLWDMYHRYRKGSGMGFTSRWFFSLSAHYVRMWDLATASRVDYFVANSHNVAGRIRKHYHRDAEVIHPPVNVSGAYLDGHTEDYYLVVGRLVGYKRFDEAILACNQLKRPLHIVGDGEEYRKLRRLAGPSVTFLGALPDEERHKQYARCRALLFPGEEDFGIVPVEAQSFGRPVIAYGCGGAVETIQGCRSGQEFDPCHHTGVFFNRQTVDSLVEAIRRFESVEGRFLPQGIRASVERFDTSHFVERMADCVERCLEAYQQSGMNGGGP